MIPTLAIGGLGRRMRVNPPSAGSVTSLMNPAAANHDAAFVDELGNPYVAQIQGGSGSAEVATGISGFNGACIDARVRGRFVDATDADNYKILNSGDFTIEAVVKFIDPVPVAAYGTGVVGSYGSVGSGFDLRAMQDGIVAAVFPEVALVGEVALPGGETWNTTDLYHMCWTRLGTTMHVGVAKATESAGVWTWNAGVLTQIPSTTVVPDGGGLAIGTSPYGQSNVYVSWRLTKRLARYTGATGAAYTPPAMPFTL